MNEWEVLRKIIKDISANFLDLPAEELDEGIKRILQTIVEATEVDHGYVYLFSADKKVIYRTHGWCSSYAPWLIPPGASMDVEKIPYLIEKINQGETVCLSKIDDLPAEAQYEKELFQTQGCKSVLLIPMIYERKSVGFIGFEAIGREKIWAEEIIGLLRMVGEIFINTLERRRAEKELQKSEERYRQLVENINDVLFSLDVQGRFVYISPVIEQIAFYRPEELIGQPLANLIYMEDLPEFLRNWHRVLLGEISTLELRITNKEGSIRHVQISARRMIEEEELTGITGMISDLTERKWAEVLIRRAEEKYRSIFENAVEGIFQSTLDGHFIVANPACARILGFNSPEELITQEPNGERNYFVDQERYRELQRLLEEKGMVENFEAEVYRRDGEKIWISMNALAIRDPRGLVQFYEGTLENITERKWADDQIRYLTFHDKLTGLYNRLYFEEELRRLDTERQLPISLIMGDVNGLKLVNDAFGHQEGDKLLIRIAGILKDCCRKEDVVARLGGDEFAIFLPRTSNRVTTEIMDRIRNACQQANYGPIQLSIAMGAFTKEDPNQSIQDVLREAEERMYRNKLLESKSVRASIISSLRRTLFEKSHETEEHTNRIQELALQIGRAFGLAESELDNLALLATLHDIGKIAIPEGLIIKPGNLSAEEWELIWKHPEIGYRIAGSSPELAPIAEAILAHHEWWDGSGYPRGLKGEEIPLISRIIAIVDAYDVMTHGRPYKEPIGQEECLRELKRKAGSQFDPNLVDLFIKIISSPST